MKYTASSGNGGRHLAQVRARFLSILPKIKTHARISFRHVRCWHKKSDCISETIALCWKWFVRLAEKGKDATLFPSTLASFAARAVKAGRRVCRQLKPKDVMSEKAQQRHGFVVGKLPDFSTLSENPLVEALHDNTQSDVPSQVQFRCDFPAWRRTQTRRNRRMLDDMMLGHRTKDLAHKHKLSQARVSQLRSEFQQDWDRFTADTTEA